MKSLKLVFCGAILIISQAVWADPYPELQHQLEQEIPIINSAITSSSETNQEWKDTGSPAEGWFFRRFFLRLRPQIALDIPAFANLKLIPEVELIWERSYPDGWETYKP